MLKEERRAMILSLLKDSSSITSIELSRIFDTTRETIRKDLNYLNSAGLLKRTFGGAMQIPASDKASDSLDPSFELRKKTNSKTKEAIAKFAATLIEPKDTIILDSSTTTLQMVKYIPEKMEITVITNSFYTLYELVKKRDISVISIGGHYRKLSTSFLGTHSIKALDSYNINKAFLSGNSVSVERGLMDPVEQEADYKRKIIEVAERSILLADHSKFERISTFSDFPLTVFDTMISDSSLDEEYIQRIKNLNIQVYIVESQS